MPRGSILETASKRAKLKCVKSRANVTLSINIVSLLRKNLEMKVSALAIALLATSSLAFVPSGPNRATTAVYVKQEATSSKTPVEGPDLEAVRERTLAAARRMQEAASEAKKVDEEAALRAKKEAEEAAAQREKEEAGTVSTEF